MQIINYPIPSSPNEHHKNCMADINMSYKLSFCQTEAVFVHFRIGLFSFCD